MLDADAPRTISKMYKERDVEGLVKVLKLDIKDGYIAWAAIKLGEIGDSEAVLLLIQALLHSSHRVRREVARARGNPRHKSR